MSSGVRIPAPKRTRRSHAERTAETRRRAMAAVVESIAEVGYQRTTGTEIARRAGVTWGAVQHHFGGKDGILMAVLEDSFNRFAARLGEPVPANAGIEERVSTFVDRAWEHFASPSYRTTFEILLNLPADLETSWASAVLATWNGIWRRYFAESRIPRRETLELMHYTVSVLSGLAATTLLEGRDAKLRTRELDFLKDTLVRELGRGKAGP